MFISDRIWMLAEKNDKNNFEDTDNNRIANFCKEFNGSIDLKGRMTILLDEKRKFYDPKIYHIMRDYQLFEVKKWKN